MSIQLPDENHPTCCEIDHSNVNLHFKQRRMAHNRPCTLRYRRLTAWLTVAIMTIPIFMSNSCDKQQTNGLSHEQDLVDSIYNNLIDSIYTNPRYVIGIIDSAQKSVADSLNYYKLELFKGAALSNTGENVQREKSYKKILEYCRRTGDSDLEAILWNYHAIHMDINLGDRDSALRCFEHAYKLLETSGNKQQLIAVCINLADACKQTGDIARSTQYYRRALSLCDSLNLKKDIFNIYVGLGQTYSEIENFKEADIYFAKALKVIDDKPPYDKYFFYNSYGNDLYLQGKHNEALEQFRNAGQIADNFNLPNYKCIVETNLSEVFMMMGKYDSAHYHLKEAQSLFNESESGAILKFYINSLAGDLALHENNAPAAMRYFAEAGDTLAVGPRVMALHYARLHRFYSMTHNYKNAYAYLLRADHYNDSINNYNVRNQMAELDYRYTQDTTILQQQLIISEKEGRVESLEIQIFIIILVVLLVALFVTVISMHTRRRRLLKEDELKQSLYSMRLANIRNRISPHFVFNILNRELSGKNNNIDNLVTLLRMNLQLCDRYTVSLQEELEFVDTYVYTEMPSLGKDFDYNKVISPAVDTESFIMPSMLIQIFVENAIKHGLRGYEGRKYLHIIIDKTDCATTITIKNNGHSTSHAASISKTGTGMRVVTQTINILNERNEKQMGLNVSSPHDSDGSTHEWNVTITIPDGFDFSPMAPRLTSSKA